MNRYDLNNITKRNSKNKMVYKSTLLPNIPISENDIYITTSDTDRLDLLAFKYYNDVTMWWIIAHANKIKNGLFVSPNMQLRIPMDISNINTIYRDLND